MDMTKEKSEEQAEIILNIMMCLHGLDVPYLRQFAKTLKDGAVQYDSMAVLNRGWNGSKSKLMEAQAKAANLLCDYKEALQKIDKLKQEVKDEEDSQKVMRNLFNW